MSDNRQPLPEEILKRIKQLQDKYQIDGQDVTAYLDGLIQSNYINYWDYINLDALLNLQHSRTPYPDEKTFIIYHQITELYFRLIRNGIELIADVPNLDAALFIKQLKRINKYFRHLTDSFSIMYDGMDRDQFLAFRMALIPASGFQSAQFRMIEICSTDVINLVSADVRHQYSMNDLVETLMNNFYWRKGAIEMKTSRKTLTLRQFEQKYDKEFIALAYQFSLKNLWQRYTQLSKSEKKNKELTALLREYDQIANVHWPIVHYRTTAFYMERKPEDIPATGGTNWQKYLPPKNQQIIYFPELWSAEEKENWGKNVPKEVIGI